MQEEARNAFNIFEYLINCLSLLLSAAVGADYPKANNFVWPFMNGCCNSNSREVFGIFQNYNIRFSVLLVIQMM